MFRWTSMPKSTRSCLSRTSRTMSAMGWGLGHLELNATLLDEPVLLFGHGGKHVDPKAGLALYGPAGHPRGGQTPTSITLGFVGAAEAVETAREWSLGLNSVFDPDKDNLRLF